MIRHDNGFLATLLAALVVALTSQCTLAQDDMGHDHDHEHDDGFFEVVHESPIDATTDAATFGPTTASTREAGLDDVFSQPSFADTPIDIIFETLRTIVRPELTELTTDSETRRLLNSSQVSSPGVNLFIVDAIDFCGSFNTRIVGCAFEPGNDFIVESSFAAGNQGVELIAHELGHNLGLPHLSGANLMNPTLNNNTTLTTTQVASLRRSRLVQGNPGSEFIRITPILVVPEPTTLALLLPGIALGFSARRRRVSLTRSSRR